MKTVFKRIVCTLLVICSLSSLAWANAIQARTSSVTDERNFGGGSGIYRQRKKGCAVRKQIIINKMMGLRIAFQVITAAHEIGISRVYVYESSDGGKTFSLYKTYLSSDYPSMMDSGITYCKAPISFPARW